jgi:SAM-dependent methyltransferase
MAWWRRNARESGERPKGGSGRRALTRGFFDDYDRFFETSQTSTQPWRLNLRHEAIFVDNAPAFEGSRVLDIASHDGRWSLAALRAGASHVTGIEARSELTDFAAQNLAGYGADPDTFNFLVGDVFAVMRDERVEVDVVLCLGFFYHTLRYPELWSLMARTGASSIIMDTMVTPHINEPMIRVARERFTREGNAVPDDFSAHDSVLTGRPTVAALRVMGSVYGYQLVSETDWPELLADNPAANAVEDYREGRRTTVRFSLVK